MDSTPFNISKITKIYRSSRMHLRNKEQATLRLNAITTEHDCEDCPLIAICRKRTALGLHICCEIPDQYDLRRAKDLNPEQQQELMLVV